MFRQNSGIVKILTDDSEQDDDNHRRTPRRVRFGGEIVKMRTPDSDSNTTGDEKEPIKTKRHTKSAHNLRSYIPVRVSSNRKSHSEPNSPQREKKHSFSLSAPDLRKSGHVFGPKVGIVSKIPRRKSNKPLFQSTIKITIDSTPEETPKVAKAKVEKNDRQSPLLNTPATHQGIEILYNLTQSPQKNANKESEADTKNDLETLQSTEKTNLSESEEPKTNFDSFQVCDVNFGFNTKERNPSFVYVNNSDGSERDQTDSVEDILKELQRQVCFFF